MGRRMGGNTEHKSGGSRVMTLGVGWVEVKVT